MEQKNSARSLPEHSPHKAELKIKKPAPAGLSPEAEAVYAVLDFEPHSADELSEMAQLSSQQTAAALTELEIFGAAVAVSGRRFRLE